MLFLWGGITSLKKIIYKYRCRLRINSINRRERQNKSTVWIHKNGKGLSNGCFFERVSQEKTGTNETTKKKRQMGTFFSLDIVLWLFQDILEDFRVRILWFTLNGPYTLDLKDRIPFSQSQSHTNWIKAIRTSPLTHPLSTTPTMTLILILVATAYNSRDDGQKSIALSFSIFFNGDFIRFTEERDSFWIWFCDVSLRFGYLWFLYFLSLSQVFKNYSL